MIFTSAHALWRMGSPEGYGKQRTFFNLVRIERKWSIVNTVDHGFQVMPEE